jgi:Xaa-Pro dipeptidase
MANNLNIYFYLTGGTYMERVNEQEINLRISKFQQLLQEKDVDVAIIVQRADLYYLTGTGQNAHLLVPAHGEATLLVRKSFDRARQESPLANVLPLQSIKELPEYLRSSQCIGMELDVLPVNLFQRYQSMLPEAKFCDISNLVRQVRMIKSEYELRQLHKAADIMDTIMINVPRLLRPGITELALAGELEAIARSHGSQGYNRMRSFNQENNFAHLFSGANAAYPSFFDGATGGVGANPSFPQGPCLDPIVPGTPIIIDITFGYNGYIIDQTRVFSLGKIEDFFHDAYRKALEIQELVVAKAIPGMSTGELYALALEKVKAMGLEDNFMGYVPDQASFIAHGIGIELDELPVIAKGAKTLLEPGMVFALEPKFIFPGKGVVGVENTFVVKDKGVEKITKSSEEIIEV